MFLTDYGLARVSWEVLWEIIYCATVLGMYCETNMVGFVKPEKNTRFCAVRGKEMLIIFTIRIIKKINKNRKYIISGYPD